MTKILWRRVDQPGHEYAELRRDESEWLLTGVALFEHEGLPCRIEYEVKCDDAWSTRSAAIAGQVGEQSVYVRIIALADRSWEINDKVALQVAGCTDIDLNFSPSTNLLPIRRLNLDIGDASRVRAAWLRFPSFTLEPLEQTYRRISERIFRYESANFVAELEISESGLPLRYGNIWRAEAIL